MQAILIYIIKLLLRFTTLTVTYKSESDNKIITRKATRKKSVLQKYCRKSTGKARTKSNNITYFDLEKQGYRTFKIQNLKSISL